MTSPFPRRTALAFLATAPFLLQACSCGSLKEEESVTHDLTHTFPGASFASETYPVRYLRCDSTRRCTFQFRDADDTTVTWSVDFVLDSVKTTTNSLQRRL